MSIRSTLTAIALLQLAIGSVASAKSPGDYAEDARDYVLAPLHWDARDWQWAAVAAAGTVAAYSADVRVRNHFAADGAAPGADPHSLRDAAPLAALTLGTYALGRWRRDDGLANTGRDMVEAVVLGGLSSVVLKSVTGRDRPNDTADRSRWREGGDSFPSMHVTAAFAAAQVFVDRMPHEQWRWRMLGYGLAGATMYGRLDSNVHWLSDTVAGAALGIATGRFVSGRDDKKPNKISMAIVPLDRGALLTFSLTPR